MISGQKSWPLHRKADCPDVMMLNSALSCEPFYDFWTTKVVVFVLFVLTMLSLMPATVLVSPIVVAAWLVVVSLLFTSSVVAFFHGCFFNGCILYSCFFDDWIWHHLISTLLRCQNFCFLKANCVNCSKVLAPSKVDGDETQIKQSSLWWILALKTVVVKC